MRQRLPPNVKRDAAQEASSKSNSNKGDKRMDLERGSNRRNLSRGKKMTINESEEKRV